MANNDPGPGIVPVAYRHKYELNGTGDNGDDLAYALGLYVRGTGSGRPKMNLDRLHSVATNNGLTIDKHSHLNPGHQRMIVSNILRRMLRNGVSVVIGDFTIKPDKKPEVCSQGKRGYVD